MKRRKNAVQTDFNPSIHITADEAGTATGYKPRYLARKIATQFRLTRMKSDTVPIFFLREEINKLAAKVQKSTRGHRYRPRPANGNGTTPPTFAPARPTFRASYNRSANGKPGVTVVANIDTVRNLIDAGYPVNLVLQK